MRVFSMALIAFAALTQAHAQENAPPAIAPLQPLRAVPPLKQPAPGPGPTNKTDAPCSYSINGYYYDVPIGTSLCWRDPFPYGAVYALIQCGPPLHGITQVKRGDPRCRGRYEMRQ